MPEERGGKDSGQRLLPSRSLCLRAPHPRTQPPDSRPRRGPRSRQHAATGAAGKRVPWLPFPPLSSERASGEVENPSPGMKPPPGGHVLTPRHLQNGAQDLPNGAQLRGDGQDPAGTRSPVDNGPSRSAEGEAARSETTLPGARRGQRGRVLPTRCVWAQSLPLEPLGPLPLPPGGRWWELEATEPVAVFEGTAVTTVPGAHRSSVDTERTSYHSAPSPARSRFQG